MLDLDTSTRVTALACPPRIPILTTFDFLAAFPHLVQEWLLEVLPAVHMPEGIRALIQAVYGCAAAFFQEDENGIILMLIYSGVLQGCALSGSLIVIALDPFLCYAQQLLSGNPDNTLHACVNDLGAVRAKFTTLEQLYKPCCVPVAFTNLQLDHPRCHIVLSVRFSQQQVHRLRVWLFEVLPQWSSMGIATTAEYLDTWIGPAAGDRW